MQIPCFVYNGVSKTVKADWCLVSGQSVVRFLLDGNARHIAANPSSYHVVDASVGTGRRGKAVQLSGCAVVGRRSSSLVPGYAVSVFSPVRRPLVPDKSTFAVGFEVAHCAGEQPGPPFPARHDSVIHIHEAQVVTRKQHGRMRYYVSHWLVGGDGPRLAKLKYNNGAHSHPHVHTVPRATIKATHTMQGAGGRYMRERQR